MIYYVSTSNMCMIDYYKTYFSNMCMNELKHITSLRTQSSRNAQYEVHIELVDDNVQVQGLIGRLGRQPVPYLRTQSSRNAQYEVHIELVDDSVQVQGLIGRLGRQCPPVTYKPTQ